jgi:hypothetical protein
MLAELLPCGSDSQSQEIGKLTPYIRGYYWPLSVPPNRSMSFDLMET